MIYRTSYILTLFILASCLGNHQKEDTVKSGHVELLINREKNKKSLLIERIDHLSNSLLLSSHRFSDTMVTSEYLFDNFESIFKLITKFRKTHNKELIESLRVEFLRLKDFMLNYKQVRTEQVKIIDDDYFNQTLLFLSKNTDSLLSDYISINLYNEILLQKLEVLDFKYDSLLYNIKDSLQDYDMNPYMKSLIVTEKAMETRHSGSPTDEEKS